MLTTMTIRAPADMHCHFRDGTTLPLVVPATAGVFGIALAMPNLMPPITTAKQALDYVDRVYAAAANVNPYFRVLGTLYLTERLDPRELLKGWEGIGNDGNRYIHAVKLYPKGGTTNSDDGVTDLHKVLGLLDIMVENDIPLLVHGEVVVSEGGGVARWEREALWLTRVYPILRERVPKLKIVLEHITTAEAAALVEGDDEFLAATITPHHLFLDDAHASAHPMAAHATCMPIIKSLRDKEALRKLAVSGHPRVFAGTDTAPHPVEKKHAGLCACGAFVAPGALEAYATVFDEMGALTEESGERRFNAFMSENGPRFYGIPPAEWHISLRKEATLITKRFFLPHHLGGGATEIVPFFHEDAFGRKTPEKDGTPGAPVLKWRIAT